MDIISAVNKNDVNEVKKCIKEQSDIYLKDKNGMNALHLAVDKQNIEIVNTIIKTKIDINGIDKYGQTALMLAAGRGNILIIKILLENKADKGMISRSKARAYDFAVENGYSNAAILLK